MWVDVGCRIPVDSSDDSTVEGGGETSTMEHTGHGEWSPEFRISFPEKGGPQKFPVAGCPGRLATRTAMGMHFVHRHVLSTVVILEEGNFPHPRCARCDMLVSRRALNLRHPGTAQ